MIDFLQRKMIIYVFKSDDYCDFRCFFIGCYFKKEFFDFENKK